MTSSAETLECDVDDGTVDLITVATAAHWFDMSQFWDRAARLLRPGGSVALWAMNAEGVHPDVPNHEAINKALHGIRDREIEAFYEVGNRVSQNLYVDLGLPWKVSPVVSGFDEVSVFRKEWGTEVNGDVGDEGEEFMLGGQKWFGVDIFEVMMGTGSPITRWREANPEKTGEMDVVRVMRREVERLLKEAGVAEQDLAVKAKMNGVLIILKRK